MSQARKSSVKVTLVPEQAAALQCCFIGHLFVEPLALQPGQELVSLIKSVGVAKGFYHQQHSSVTDYRENPCAVRLVRSRFSVYQPGPNSLVAHAVGYTSDATAVGASPLWLSI